MLKKELEAKVKELEAVVTGNNVELSRRGDGIAKLLKTVDGLEDKVNQLKDENENLAYENKRLDLFLRVNIGLSLDQVTDVIIHGSEVDKLKIVRNISISVEKRIREAFATISEDDFKRWNQGATLFMEVEEKK